MNESLNQASIMDQVLQVHQSPLDVSNEHSQENVSLHEYLRSYYISHDAPTFIPAAAAGPQGSTAWMWHGLLPLTTKPQPTASPTICRQTWISQPTTKFLSSYVLVFV